MRLLAIALLSALCACSTTNRERAQTKPASLIAELAKVRDLGWIGHGEEPFIEAGRFVVGETSARPRIEGALSSSGVRISAGDGAFVELEPMDAAPAGGTPTKGAIAYSDMVWAWSSRAVEHVHVLSSPRTLSFRLRVGPELVSAKVEHDRVWLFDKTGRSRLQTDSAWVEDAHKTRRPIVPVISGVVPELRLELRFDAAGLVPPLVVDPAWTKVASMNRARRAAPVVTLADGSVLVISAETTGTFGNSYEIYNPSTNVWTLGALGNNYDYASRAVRLTSGKVLAATDASTSTRAQAELYDPASKTWTATGNLNQGREAVALVALADGRALIAGGDVYGASTFTALSSVEIFDPATKTFTTVAPMSKRRYGASAWLMSDGKVLVAGGSDCPSCYLSTSEIYNPTANTWTAGPSLTNGHERGTAVTLGDGRFLLVGGYSASGVGSVELFSAGAWSLIGTTNAWTDAGVAPFGASRALIATGCATCTNGGIEVFNGTTLVAGDPPIDARRDGPLVAPLPGGKVLVAGADGIDGPLSSAEVFAPLGLGQACAGSGSCAASTYCVDSVCCDKSACATGETCAGPALKGTCKLKNGATCTSGTACGSGLCVDGTCCDRACNGQCEACDVTGSKGTCVPVAGAPHGARAVCTTTPTACGLSCDGVDPSKCNLASRTTPCSSDSCVAGVERHARLCDGAGNCLDTPKACGAYVCGKTACKTSCATSSDCTAGFGCKSGVCVPAEGLGTTCTSNAECTSGYCVDGVCCGVAACPLGSVCNLAGKEGTCQRGLGGTCTSSAECGAGTCVDGVCCDSACTGQCEACDVSGKEGTCSPVIGAPHGVRTACASGEGTCDARVCDGKERASCAGFTKGLETTCGAAKCVDQSFVGPSKCDGAGKCTAPTPTSCAPFVCEETGCKTTCTADTHCQSGFGCISGRCVKVAARCAADSLASEASDGRTVSCSPYRCNPSSGTCRSACLATDECAPGFACAAGACVSTTPPATTEEESGGCTAARSSSGAPVWLALLCVGAIVARRRRLPLAAGALVAVACNTRDPHNVPVNIEAPATTPRGWTTQGGTLSSAAQDPLVVPTPDGSAYVFGIVDGLGCCTDVWKWSSGALTKFGALSTARTQPVGGRLPSGKILVAGGMPPSATSATSTAELYDPATGTSTPAPSMSRGRYGRSSLVLSNGDVLVAGGLAYADGTTTAERFVATSGTWQLTGPMPDARGGGVMTQLANGKVLFVSIFADSDKALLYDPTANTWSTAAALIGSPRYEARLAKLPSGKVLVFGAGTGFDFSTFAEIYDPTANTFTATPSLPARIYGAALARLPSGRILVAGGNGFSGPRLGTLVYNPLTNAWLDASPLAFAQSGPAAGVLSDGSVLLVGGAEKAQLFVEGAVGAACKANGDCANLQCVDGVCCATASCPTGSTCAPGGTCKLARGVACTTDAACASAHCVDGVCCDSACAGQCSACNVAGNVGTCSAVAGAPRGSRAACSGPGLGTPCGPRCDGVTLDKCTFAPASTACGADACVAGIETKRATCDGAGSCADTSLACAPFTCGATTCKTSCTSSADCAPGAYCKGSVCIAVEGLGAACASADSCVSKNCVDGVCCATSSCPGGQVCNDPARKGSCARPRGGTCAVSAECATNHCIDGVCCDTTCDGQCEACDVSGKVGTCTPIDGAPHGARPSCEGPSDGPDGACAARTCLGSKDQKTCAGFANAAGASCGPARCDGSSFTAASTCDGAGKCVQPAAASCAPYACNGEGCLKKCTLDLDCAAGWICKSEQCVAQATSCSEDLLASVDKDGKATPCAPYRCQTDGTCRKDCATSDDCAPGNVCDVGSKTCTAAAAASDDEGGCHFGRSERFAPALALIALAFMVRRRRR